MSFASRQRHQLCSITATAATVDFAAAAATISFVGAATTTLSFAGAAGAAVQKDLENILLKLKNLLFKNQENIVSD